MQARHWHTEQLNLQITGKHTMWGSIDSPQTIMKHKKQNNRKQSPHEIRQQIIEKLKKERDPMEREMLQQRLHHYNLILNK